MIFAAFGWHRGFALKPQGSSGMICRITKSKLEVLGGVSEEAPPKPSRPLRPNTNGGATGPVAVLFTGDNMKHRIVHTLQKYLLTLRSSFCSLSA
jgi:hypothetical protein